MNKLSSFIKNIFFLCLCLFANISAEGFIEITIPKTGTNLLEKAVKLITQKTDFAPEIAQKLAIKPGLRDLTVEELAQCIQLDHDKFLRTHLHYKDSLAQFLSDKRFLVLFNILFYLFLK